MTLAYMYPHNPDAANSSLAQIKASQLMAALVLHPFCAEPREIGAALRKSRVAASHPAGDTSCDSKGTEVTQPVLLFCQRCLDGLTAELMRAEAEGSLLCTEKG